MKKSRPTFHILTIFPEMCASYLNEAILKRAQIKGVISCAVHNLRDFARGAHRKTDDRPYGGGPGMVMYAEPILRAIRKIISRSKIRNQNSEKKKRPKGKKKIVLLAPGEKQFTSRMAIGWGKNYDQIVFVCGRYEGVDGRVKKALRDEWKGHADIEEVSLGPFILTGGELPALVMIDAVARHIPGVLGNEASPEEKRVAAGEMYTRPEILSWAKKKYRVPKVLLSGDHKKIEEWKTLKKRKNGLSRPPLTRI